MSKVIDQKAKGLSSRPLDLIYFIYFTTHIPVTLAIDAQLVYPPQFVPQFLKDALSFYIKTYKDPFIGSPVPLYWYLSFIFCELLIQLPFFFIASIGIYKNLKTIRLPLAIYGAHVATTVLPLLAETIINNSLALNGTERLTLVGFFGPYFILPLIMIVDSSIKVNSYLNASKDKTE